MNLQEKVEKALGFGVNEVQEENGAMVIVFPELHDITFEELSKLSEAFQTKKINIGEDKVEYGGYCETCSYTIFRPTVYIRDYTA